MVVRCSLIQRKVDAALPKLKSLGLMDTQWTDEGSEHLWRFCPNITELRVGSKSERVTDESFRKLSTLENLSKLVFEASVKAQGFAASSQSIGRTVR